MSTSGKALVSIKLEKLQKSSQLVKSDEPGINFTSFIAQNIRHGLLMVASVCALSLFKIERNSEGVELDPVEKIETGLLDFCLWNEIQQIFIGWRPSGIIEIFRANHQNGMLRFLKRMEWPQGILSMKWSPSQEVIALLTKKGMIFGELNEWKWETFPHKFLDQQTRMMQWINNEKVVIGLKKGGVIMMNTSGEVFMGVGIHTFELTRNEIWMPTPSRVVLIEPWTPIQTADRNPYAPESSCLLIAFSNKTIQFRKNLEDAPITTVFCDLPVSFARWSPDGSIVAVGGNHKKINFFSSQGKKLGELTGTSDYSRLDLTWDSSGNFIFCLGALLGCSLQSLAISKVTPVFEEVERREGETERDMLLPQNN